MQLVGPALMARALHTRRRTRAKSLGYVALLAQVLAHEPAALEAIRALAYEGAPRRHVAHAASRRLGRAHIWLARQQPTTQQRARLHVSNRRLDAEGAIGAEGGLGHGQPRAMHRVQAAQQQSKAENLLMLEPNLASSSKLLLKFESKFETSKPYAGA